MTTHRNAGSERSATDYESSRDELLSTRQAARVLAISASGMRRLQQNRRIRFIKIGRSVRFSRKDLDAYIAGGRIEAITG